MVANRFILYHLLSTIQKYGGQRQLVKAKGNTHRRLFESYFEVCHPKVPHSEVGALSRDP